MRTLCVSHSKVFETFRNCCLFCKFWLLRNFYSDDVHHGNYFERCSNHHFRHWAHCVYQIYSVLKLFEIPVCIAHFGCSEILLLWCAHANYGERCSNHHFPHCAHVVYQIYSVLKSFEIAVCFAHFGFYKISTPVMPTTLSVANIVCIIISNIAHIVCITFKAFWSFLKWVFVLNILALTKFLLRWCAPC